VFQIIIAICSGPRFALIFLWYLLTYRRGTAMPKVVVAIGVLRTFLCGGWVYVTSTDDHGFHDITMIGYLLCTLPWTLGVISMSPLNPRALKYRKIIAASFFGTLVPLIYFFIQHKVHKVAGGASPSLTYNPDSSVHDLCVFRVGTRTHGCCFRLSQLP
jgi:Frag1/DRAM/Sfk1 family